ncbi:signal recognition particle protein [Magnetospirillum gryphiswaldense]|uniref:Signal recognition particle protein n=1 Tax=Magnetospirillum gryphiswaldense TaxID=55518 RepID=A4TWN1_9PROT|nr:signal recognition particle protein [Magnetospirillum gryphiswaldense]AVM75724.1 Signal recognition particle protein [Magnetospirillum gryphiswaldense MSR-1]AVM79627.1 Signal recognition particle protein [Magnetospirillum gryphiswaldense]CAM75038.1 Signal recognition particle GTPase [Magnetospirillum gryphiswaldense MSR-1]
MFESLSQRLSGVFDKLTGRGALSEADVTEALREVRVALLEADVALSVVKDFVGRVKARAIGQDVIKSVTPGQLVVKIVHDELIATLGTDGVELNLNAVPPAVILMVGLQGSGKTTTSGKLAVRLKKDKKKVLLASLDVYRPAAQQQLEILARQADVGSLPIIMGEMPVAITKRALDVGRKEGYDVVILDTAGRLHIDQELMAEVAAVRDVAKPVETLLVVDAMIGQDAVTLAHEFNEKVGVTGMVLTRVDGDSRGGAALSMRAVTGRPIKFLGMGEKLEALEPFHPDRLAGRILGMGDVVSLVEKAMENIEQDEAEKLAKRIEKGKFDLNDMLSQFKQVEKMGDLKGIIGMLPGLGKMANQLKDAKIDDKMVGRQKAVILSMTLAERKNPDLIKASRKKRIAAGSGVSVQDVNKLLKQYQQMADVMKKVGKLGQKGLMRHGLGGLMPPGMKGFGR